MGAIVNQGLPPAVRDQGVAVHRLPPAARAQLAHALHPAFLAAAGVCLVAFVIALVGVQEQPLRKGFEDVAVADEASPQAAATVAD
jgi:hypothetical protein